MKPEVKSAWLAEYSHMMELSAWKDLERQILEEAENSMKRIDCKSASDLSLGEVCEERGYRKGLNKVLKMAKQKVQGI